MHISSVTSDNYMGALQAELIGNIVLGTGVLKRKDSVVCRDILWHIYIDMDENITFVTY